jgi:polyisoprenoid-binding protein YceI
MTLRDTTRSLTFDVDIDVNEDEFFMLGSINFNHSDFNMEPYGAFGGFVKNSQPLTISFDMLGFPQ